MAPSADTSPPGDPGPSEGPKSTDPAGRSDLDAYPRPSLAVDVAVMSVVPAAWTTGPDGGRSGSGGDGAADGRSEAGSAALKLAVVLLRRDGAPHAGQWSLPGSFVHEHERLADTVRRTLLDKCGITDLSPTQLQVFDDPKLLGVCGRLKCCLLFEAMEAQTPSHKSSALINPSRPRPAVRSSRPARS